MFPESTAHRGDRLLQLCLIKSSCSFLKSRANVLPLCPQETLPFPHPSVSQAGFRASPEQASAEAQPAPSLPRPQGAQLGDWSQPGARARPGSGNSHTATAHEENGPLLNSEIYFLDCSSLASGTHTCQSTFTCDFEGFRFPPKN